MGLEMSARAAAASRLASSAALGIALAAAPAWADNTCVNTTIAGDQQIWTVNSFMRQAWYRDQAARFYNLQQGEWDESWGWVKYNDAQGYRWEFVKMMSAATVLWMGLDNGPFTQGRWAQGYVGTFPADAVPARRPKLAVVSRSADSVDLFYRDSFGKLRHKALSGSPWPADQSPPLSADAVVVSDLVATSKDGFTISSDPVAVARDAESVDVFALDRNRHLLHFAWTAASGWSANDVTLTLARPERVNGSDRYFVDSNLTALRRTGQTIDLFATDNFSHLIHFELELGLWSATDLTQTLGKDVFRVRDGVAAAKRDDKEGLSALGRTTSRKLLLFEWERETGWTGEDLGPVLAEGTRSVDSRPALVLPDAASTFIYYRSGYSWYLAVKLPGWGWADIDLTGSSHAVEGDPVAIKHERFAVDAFIRDVNGSLILSAFRPEVFETRNLSLIGNFPRIRSDPVAIASGGRRADVFAHSFGDHLVHYWSSGSDWSAEDAHASPRIFGSENSVDGIYPVRRRDSALDVFAGRRGVNGSTLHFWSLFGRATNPWHSTEEYSRWAAGSLHDFRYDPLYSYDAGANAYRGAATDNVEMECPSFTQTPGMRASFMLHEATHMNYWRFSHQDNPGSNCNEPCSDDWFWHGSGEPGGALGSSARNHSMTQVEVEFLCDLSEFARFDLPSDASSDARSVAGTYMTTRILNPPGWTCGVPRPLH